MRLIGQKRQKTERTNDEYKPGANSAKEISFIKPPRERTEAAGNWREKGRAGVGKGA